MATTEDESRQAPYLAGLFHATKRSVTTVKLPISGQVVMVSTMLRDERSWTGPRPTSFGDVPNKPALQFNDQPIWAEFILVRLLEGDGWQGAWVKNWNGREFLRDIRETVELPSTASALFRRIEKRTAGRGGGCWDIFAWRGDDFLFIESKQHGQDKLQLTQRTWLESAREEGVPLSSFAIVEWQKR
ncbi:MAG: VRR-NUC domain-containing protein [Planctomycetota bacterium]|nr:VRR-NUC domain-containing protein [Planctomycetota bacterium]